MQLNLQMKPPERSKLKHYCKEQQRIFDIITGKIRYPQTDFRDLDLTPDLIIRIAVPTSKCIPRKDYLQLSNYVAFPSQKLERAFQKAYKLIIKQMSKNRQNNDPNNLKIRFQQAIIPCELKVKQKCFINQINQKEALQIQAVHQNDGTLDCFTLQYNAIIYILQHVCGFRVRSFLLYDEKQEKKEIYLFLSLSSDNLVNLAKGYRIKKEIDYTFIDFFLNDPTDHDQRPIKYLSAIKTDNILLQKIKSIKRYFKVGNSEHETTDIVAQRDLQDEENLAFRDYIEQITEVFEYYKYKCRKDITNKQKSYLFEYNRRKINKGCEKLYAVMKQRQQFFQINKQILQKYGYQWYDEPLVYQQFSLPDKQSKYSTFFQRLYALLLYKPMIINEHGDLDLFLNMERTKLAYLTIKNHFKVNYLKKMGFDFLTLSNNFEKFGNEGQISGGLNGENLNSKWSIYGIFSDINTIRSYVGDNIGFQILITSKLIIYFLVIVVPFVILYIIEQLFGDRVYLYTTFFQTLLYSLSFQLYLFYWSLSEQEYIKNYQDSVSSKIFLNDYRGPYRRNIITDEVNEFQREYGFKSAGINLLCILIITTLLVVMGAVFHGCRMLLVYIYQPLSYLQVANLSFPHIISYLLFFAVVDLSAFLATDKVISFMVQLQNPPTDEQKKQWKSFFRFLYLLGIELIPPFFFFILEPFSSTSCYSDQCLFQIEKYVFSRIMISFLVSTVRVGTLIVFEYLRAKQSLKYREPVIYQERLSALLTKTLKQARKKEHIFSFNQTISIFAYFSIYCNVLPITALLSLIAFSMQHTNIRLEMLYKKRRPINRSEPIMPFKKSVVKLYYIGLFSQVWLGVFLFQYVQNNFQVLIEAVSTTVTYQAIFLLKIVIAILDFLIMIGLSRMVGRVIQGYSSDALLKRKDKKFRQFVESRGRMKRQIKKPEEYIPLKSVFRTHNPQKTDSQQLSDDEQVSIPSVYEEEGIDMDSQNHIKFQR